MKLLKAHKSKVVGTRKNGRARRRHTCLPRARPFALSPTTSKRLLRRLGDARQPGVNTLTKTSLVAPRHSKSEKALLRREALGTRVLGRGRAANIDVAELFFPT